MDIDPACGGASIASHRGSDNETMLELSMTLMLTRSSHPFKPGSSRALIGGYLAMAKGSALPVFHQTRLKQLSNARLIRAESHNSGPARQHDIRAAGQTKTTTARNTEEGDKARPSSEIPRSSEDRAISETKILPGQGGSLSKSSEAIFRLRIPV